MLQKNAILHVCSVSVCPSRFLHAAVWALKVTRSRRAEVHHHIQHSVTISINIKNWTLFFTSPIRRTEIVDNVYIVEVGLGGLPFPSFVNTDIDCHRAPHLDYEFCGF